jgi:hypothetical protein
VGYFLNVSDLARLYYTLGLPTAFSSEDKLSADLRDRAGVRKWLETQDSYKLHRPVRKEFLRNPYTISNLMDVWDCDLIDIPSLARNKVSYGQILSAIDILSKYLHLVPLKTKTGTAVAEAYGSILEDPRYSARIPYKQRSVGSIETNRFATCCDARESNTGHVETRMLNAQSSRWLIEIYEINCINTSVKKYVQIHRRSAEIC